MTLSDFLLARIAEDEEAAKRAVIWRTANGLAWIGATPAEATCLAISGHRLLAECQAKRQIVGLARHIADSAWQDGALVAVSEFRADRMLRLLALLYADHQDYREEWKP